MTEIFKRVLKPTTKMTVTITYSEGQLSFTGTGWHGSGQVVEHLTKDNPAPEFTRKDCFRLMQAWKRWHLNYMRAGTPRQEEVVRTWMDTAIDKSYEATCAMLEGVGLLFDNGYKYGSAWLKEEVPEDVLEWLFSLPGDGNTYLDIYQPEIDEQAFMTVLSVR